MRWFEISTNPEAADVLTFRMNSVSTSKVSNVDRLQTYVSSNVKDLKVLDIG